MASSNTLFICSNCDAQHLKWSGRCSECGKWGTLNEQDKEALQVKKQATANVSNAQFAVEKLTTLSDVSSDKKNRIITKISELDTVVGGGIVQGSLILLGGDPGIGKSTLSLQILQSISEIADKPLYISGEESGQQIKLRADRLGVKTDKINFLSQTNVETIAGSIEKHKPSLAIVDSIQTIYSKDVDTDPGSVSQVRACTVKLLQAAKNNNVPIILIGHVTKDGQVAGPKTLEHLVDTVLYLEGDRYHTFRLLRTVKNRFGPTNEVGVFEMTSEGLIAVSNPSALFLSATSDLPGSVVTCIMEGTRPFLIEIQALVSHSDYPTPQRRASGYDVNRLQLLLAVLSKRAGLKFANMDVHVNVVGGLKVKDPSTDLAVAMALASALKDQPFDQKTLVLGEIGLAGEIRPVRQLDNRLKEAAKLGYEKAYAPKQKAKASLDIEIVEEIKTLF